MKTKLLAIVLSILCLIQPVMAVGMVGVESAEETTVSYVETVEAETNAVLASDNDEEIIVFDDFENAADGFTTANKPAFATDKGGLSAYFSNGDVGSGTITTVNGNNVMLVSGSLGKWNNIGVRFGNLPIVNVGTYKLTFKAYRCLTSGYESITNWRGYHMNWTSANYNNFKAVNDEEWVTYTETFVVKEADGVKSIDWTKDDGTTGALTYNNAGQTVHFYMVANGAGEAGTADGKISTGTTMSWYLDDVSLSFKAPEVLAENIAVRENFENETAGGYISAKFTKAPSYTTSAFASATNASWSTLDYKYAEIDGNMVLVQKPGGDYKMGVGLFGGTYADGDYVYSMRIYPVTEAPKSFTIRFTYGGATTDVNLGNITTATKPVAGQWNTLSYPFRIYTEDGARKLDVCGRATVDFNGTLDLANFTTVTAGTEYYFDDILLTYEAPAVPAQISFVDTEGNAFDYTTEATGTYTLPAAATLGLAYAPAFTYEGVTYAAGENVAIAKGTTEAVFVVSKSSIILKADGAATAAVATGEAADAVVKGTVKDGAYECNYSGWGANLIADGLKLGSYGTYTFDYDVIHSGTDEFALHTMLYNSTSGGDGVTSIQPGVLIKNGTTHISHSVTIYEKDGAPYFKNREGNEFALDTHGYFPSVRAVAMGTQSSGKFMLDNLTISFTPAAPEALDLVGYRIADEGGKGGPSGMRFASFVTDTQIESATEYGFIVTLKDSITTAGVADYDKVNLEGVTADRTSSISATNSDGVKVLAGAAFNENTNKVYALDGSTFSNGTISYKGVFETFFTGVLYGIPEGQEDTIFVARPYIVVDGVFYYGNCVERSYNQVLDAAGIG